MKRYMLALAAAATLAAGVTAANAVEFGVGPNGIYVGPGYDHRYYRDYDRGYGDCRVVITHHTNRYGEDVVVRQRVCD